MAHSQQNTSRSGLSALVRAAPQVALGLLIAVGMPCCGAAQDESTLRPPEKADNGASLPAAGPGAWVSRAPLPVPRSSFAYAAVGERIYVIGGTDEHGDSARVDVYDARRDAWSEGPALPRARTAVSAAVVDGLVCVIGGLAKGALVADHTCLELDRGTWVSRRPLDAPRSLVGVAVREGKLWAIGGRAAEFLPTDAVESYDATSDSWKSEVSLPRPREGISAFTWDGRLFAVGGFYLNREGGEQYLDEVLALENGAWTAQAHLAAPAVALAATPLGSAQVLVVGGYADHGSPFLDRAEGFALPAWTPAAIAPLPSGRAGLGLAVAAKRVFAFGGATAASGKVAWAPQSNVWELVP